MQSHANHGIEFKYNKWSNVYTICVVKI